MAKKNPSETGSPESRSYFPAFLLKPRNASWVLALVAFGLYANTLFHDYTQDDAIVIYENMFTQQGIGGIPGILKYDTFRGFFKEEGKEKLVSGGRYRPLTLVMFALEWQVFGKSPFMGHLINILLFSLLCVLVFQTLYKLMQWRLSDPPAIQLGFFAALLFTVHPVHTEAVANIKGRDEIMALMGAVAGLWFAIRSVRERKQVLAWIGALCYLAGLFSKENTITFLAVIPLAVYFFGSASWQDSLRVLPPFLIASLTFLMARFLVLGWDMGGSPSEMMNNPFLKVESGQYVAFTGAEKSATILYTLGKYLQLLIFPHPLTHDYYPRHIGILHWNDPLVLLSLLAYAGLIVLGIRMLKSRSLIGFGIFYYLITLSIVSNILFPVGTNMSERFIFMPSLGFCLAIPLLFLYKSGGKKTSWVFRSSGELVILAMCLLMSAKTFARNQVWKDNYTLFTTDVKTSVNSAKLQNAVGGELIVRSEKEKDPEVKRRMLTEAIEHLQKAIAIHPNYKNAFLLMGNAFHYLEQYDDAIKGYTIALQLDPNYRDARNNLGVTYRAAGRFYGEKKNDLSRAIEFLNKAREYLPQDSETLRLLGVAYGISNQPEKAIEMFEQYLKLDPENPVALWNLGNAYKQAGQTERGEKLIQDAKAKDPNVGK